MIQVAILGCGTVGSGVYEVLSMNHDSIAGKAEDTLEVKYILDRKDFSGTPLAGKVVRDFSIIENDPDVAIVCETMGGVDPAFDYSARALKKGKHVVTSNKELVATHGAELLELARQNNVNYLFEASVGGGIPILRPMMQCLSANEVSEVCGILNGTTNYILTRMIRAGLSFEDALKEAQQKGYAEANPAADVEGHDAARKTCILASLVLGKHVYPDAVAVEGITGISLDDVTFASSMDKVIKLLGRVVRQEGKVFAFVSPHLIDKSHPLAGVEDVFNTILVDGNAVGQVMFYGAGAGKLPTASAVVADVIDCARHLHLNRFAGWQDSKENLITPAGEFVCSYYVRFAAADAAAVTAALAPCQTVECPQAPAGQAALVTEPLSGADMAEKLAALGGKALSCIRIL